MNVFFIACLFIFNVGTGFADDDDRPLAKTTTETASPGAVALDAKAQSLSGLQTTILDSVSHQDEFAAYGKAVNIQPLIELRHRYLLALSERGGATAKFAQAEQNIKRQQDLYREGATSKRNLQMQQAEWQSGKALVEASNVESRTIMEEARLTWGKKLADWALSSNSDPLSAFLSGQKTLLHITLPANKQLADDTRIIHVAAGGGRNGASKAELISIAPQTDSTMQGESYFFQTEDKHIRTGMRVAAWIPEQDETRTGVVIPKSAVVWYMDQAFVYVKTDDEKFSRRAIERYSNTADGYFVGSGINAGEELVVTGGQMLLSEELRGQIPDEDDD